MRFSLLTLIITISLILLALKMSDIFSTNGILSAFNPISNAYAQENAEDEATDEQSDETTDEDDEEENIIEQKVEYTPTELDILQRLANRRSELVKWESDLEIKESILRITQEKIDSKIVELRSLKEKIEAILQEYNAKESKKIQSLVKIYENMKPKAAAEIFSQLDIATLLSVVEKMKEDKVALILAKMQPKLAKELTISFAQQGKLIPPSNSDN